LTTYRDAGVDLDRAERFTRYVKRRVREVFPAFRGLGLGDFAGGLELGGYREPVIFSTTDGVGTKLKIAQEIGIHDTVGIDLVAMNVNDILTTGATPLMFLDYIATGRIDLDVLRCSLQGEKPRRCQTFTLREFTTSPVSAWVSVNGRRS